MCNGILNITREQTGLGLGYKPGFWSRGWDFREPLALKYCVHFEERVLLCSSSPFQFVTLPSHLFSETRSFSQTKLVWTTLLPQPPQVPEFISMCCHRRPFIRNSFPVKILGDSNVCKSANYLEFKERLRRTSKIQNPKLSGHFCERRLGWQPWPHAGCLSKSLFQTTSELFKEKIKPNLLLTLCSKRVCLFPLFQWEKAAFC